MAIKISLKEFIESGAHFGHQSKRWNPKMKTYLHGIKEGVHIFDLTKTKKALKEALKVLKTASKDGEKILFLGTKKQAKEKTRQVALATGSFFVDERWLGGTLTNFDQIKKSTSKLTEMKKKMAKGDYKSYTKKERLLIEREIARLERFFGGISEMQQLPDLLVIVDTKKEIGAVREAKMKGVKTIAIVDSNSDPTLVDYAIPMNDDATKAIDYVLGLMQKAIEEGNSGKKSSKSTNKSTASGKSQK